MPRKPRHFLANVPCHVISRGNNHNVCFFTHDDYLFYLECLSEACLKHQVSVHAYVLMTNHVHLLMTPVSSSSIPKVMQSIGRRYVQYINKTYRRSGTLWEGRYKASIVDAENYLLACYRYIELNPVRASMVEHPADYPWSSYQVNAGIKPRRQLVMHDIYQRLGIDEYSRQYAYRELFSVDLSKNLLHDIQRAIGFSMPLGNESFIKQIEQVLACQLGYAKRGRPAKKKP
jgi:putative transposase